MLSDICNKEIAINGRKKILLESQEPFHLIFVKRTYRKSFKNNVNRLIDLKQGENENGTARPRGKKKLIKTTPCQATIISY